MEKMRQWSVFTAIGVLAVLVIGWFMLVSPQRSKAAKLRDQAATQQSANLSLQGRVNQLEQQKRGLPAQQKLLDQIATKVPDNPELPALVRQLSAAAQGAGVDLVSLAPAVPALVTAPPAASTSLTTGAAAQPAAAAAPSTLAQIPVSIQVSGTYFNVESFFAAVEKMSRAVLVTQFTLAPGSKTPTSGAANPLDLLTGNISAVVFESPSTTTTSPSQTSPVASSAPSGK